MLHWAQTRANKRGVPCTITENDILSVWPTDNKCPVLGTIFIRGKGRASPTSPSLDCFNPELGYIPGNISIVSYLVNSIKWNVSDPEVFDKIAAWMRKTKQDGIKEYTKPGDPNLCEVVF